MRRRVFLWVFVASWLGAAGAGCASETRQGDETHFQKCGSDADCNNLGPNYRCEANRCSAPDASSGTGGSATGGGGAGGSGGKASGGGGTGGSGGTPSEAGPCEPAAGGFPAFPYGGACNNYGGAIGYVGCPGFFDSGLRDISCAPDGGTGARPALVDFCDHMGEVAQLFEQRIVFECVSGTLHMAQGHFGPREGGGGGGGWASFDEATLCAPTAVEDLRQCTARAVPCARPPMCTADGTFGCDDIVAACPALTSSACRSGFDTRDYAGRERIRTCLGSDGGDCVNTFYRCAWGL